MTTEMQMVLESLVKPAGYGAIAIDCGLPYLHAKEECVEIKEIVEQYYRDNPPVEDD